MGTSREKPKCHFVSDLCQPLSITLGNRPKRAMLCVDDQGARLIFQHFTGRKTGEQYGLFNTRTFPSQ